MYLLSQNFFENRSKKWWVSLAVFLTLFFLGAGQEFDAMYLEKIKPASETMVRYQMMLLCFLFLLLYFVPFVFFVRYSCRRMHVSGRFPVIAFLCGWFIPGWIAGELNDGSEWLLRRLTSKSFTEMWGDALTAPIVEETLKVLVVVWLLALLGRTSRQHFLLAGMSAGMGFQISEDLGYIEMQAGGSHREFTQLIPFTLTERVAGGLVSHWCYTAVMAVAVWMIFYGKKRKRGILLLLVPLINHGLWDSPLDMQLLMAVLSAWMFLVFFRQWTESLPASQTERKEDSEEELKEEVKEEAICSQ